MRFSAACIVGMHIWLLMITGAIPLITERVQAQSVPTNLAVFQQLAENCLASLPGDADSLKIVPPPTLFFLAGSVASVMQNNGHIVFIQDGTEGTGLNLPQLSWVVENAGVQYARARSRTVARSVRLDLRYTFVSPEGQILSHGPCTQMYNDTVHHNELTSLETAAYPETQAEPPPAGWIRRYLEPVLLATATALAAFLFFNLRSDRADS